MLELRENRTVKAYPELGQAALRAKAGNLYRLWLLARLTDTQGRGWLDIRELLTSTAGVWSAQSVKRHIKAGAGSWWTVDACGRLWLRGLEHIAAGIGENLTAHPVYLPLDTLRSLGDFSAACLASMMAGKERTIGRTTLARLYGRKVRTISNYTKRAAIRGLLAITPQAAIITTAPARAAYIPELAQQGYFITRVKGEQVLAKHLPNSYGSNLETAAYGQVARIKRQSSLLTTGASYRKLYFDPNSRQLHGAILGLELGAALYIQGAGKADDGTRLLFAYENNGAGAVFV